MQERIEGQVELNKHVHQIFVDHNDRGATPTMQICKYACEMLRWIKSRWLLRDSIQHH